ncbi:ATP-dependent DNA helicase pif1 [Glycine soja]
MTERLTAVQNFDFLVKIPIAESLTPVQVFCFLVIYALLGWVGFLPPYYHVLFYGSMIMVLSHVAWCVVDCSVVYDFGARLWFPVRDFRSSVVEGLCNFMARIPDKIRSIDGSKETFKLAVRITDLWFVGTPNKFEQAEMVFVDSEGDQIHAICKSDHLKSWKAYLKENCTYVMHNFKVVKNDGQFRVCEHEYKLFFIGVTVVREADLHELPFKEFRFVEFANVVAGNFVSGLLVVFRHVSSKNTRVVFRMKDLSEILSCTLWENYCTQFLSYLNERGHDGPMVVILMHARIKYAQESCPASVSNSFKASKLLINDPILEIQEFKERLLDLGVDVSRVLLPGDQASSQVSGGSQLSSKDSFLSKAEAKTILEINAISEDVVCVTVGTISKIVMDNHSWCYPACAQCHRKTDIQTGPFTCGCGKDNDQPVLRYRLKVMVTQNNESGKFLLWDHECAELIGQTTDGVNRVKIEVRIQSRLKNVVVLKYSKDLDLINVVLEMLPDSEVFFSDIYFSRCCHDDMIHEFDYHQLIYGADMFQIDPSNVDCNDATHVECQFLSATADHDPVAGLPLTPKKRMSSDEADDELGSSHISIGSFLILNVALKAIDFPSIRLTEKETIHLCLTKIENMLQANRRSLRDFTSMPYAIGYARNQHHNNLIHNEMAYDKEMLAEQYNTAYQLLTDEQKTIVDTIMSVVNTQSAAVYFLCGYGGTGKTFVWTTLSSGIRSNGGIVCTVASSGIVSLLLPGGRIAHSKFAMPVPATENSTCNIHQGSELAELLKVTKLMVWDEAPMCHKFAFEELDKSLKDIMQNNLPFGGKIMILLIVPKGNCSDIVHATINASYIWDHCQILKLTKNMRLLSNAPQQPNNEELKQFSH